METYHQNLQRTTVKTSLDLARLENVKHLANGSIRAACPACRAAGSDKTGEHLLIQANGKFGCAVHPNDHEHRKKIYKMVGTGHSQSKGSPPTPKPAFDWQKCVSDFDEAEAQKLVTWRGLSDEFVRWLHSQKFIGLYNSKPAFPVHRDGTVIACHWRVNDKLWNYYPKGSNVSLLVFGNPATAGIILAFESQWDAFAVMDKMGWHLSGGLPDTAVLITRGAGNGKLIRGHVSPDSLCYAFKQNDLPTQEKPIPPADTWLADIAANAGCKVLNVTMPPLHKDCNDWIKAGATAEELQAAMKAGKMVQVPPAKNILTELAESKITTSKNETEFELANRLADTLPPIKTVSSTWHAYENGTWHKTDRSIFRPKAQAILPETVRTARREATLLAHLEGRNQVLESDFAGFYKIGRTGEILINVANGVLQVKPDGTTILSDHSPEHLFTLRVSSMFSPKSECPLFHRVLVELLPDEDDRKLIQLFSGYMLLPDCRFEAALISYGEAGRGKSTIAEAIANALGSDLVARLTMSQICDPKSYHVPKLRYAAVNLGTELDAVELGDSATFKAIASGETIEARPIFGSPFTMKPPCKLMFLANSLPRFKHGTDAELRRLRFLRFDVLPGEKNVTLKAKLAAEHDGIFLWMIEGLRELLKVTEMPVGGKASRAVLDRFRVSNDPVGSFVTLRCQLVLDATTPKEELRKAFSEFCERHALPVSGDDWFLKSLYERWPQLRETRPTNDSGQRYYAIAGIALRK